MQKVKHGSQQTTVKFTHHVPTNYMDTNITKNRTEKKEKAVILSKSVSRCYEIPKLFHLQDNPLQMKRDTLKQETPAAKSAHKTYTTN